VWKFPIDPTTGDSLSEEGNSFLEAGQIEGTTGSTFDTFYFRVQGSRTIPVPEPSTLIIFALGLIALVSKKRLFSYALTNFRYSKNLAIAGFLLSKTRLKPVNSKRFILHI